MGLTQKVASCILIIGCLISLVGCNPDKSDTVSNSTKTLTTVIIKYEEKEHDITAIKDDKGIRFIYSIDGKETDEFTGDYITEGYMTLPKPGGNHVDISQQGLITDSTYEMNINMASDYVEQLKSDGYIIKFEANTPKFIELYLENTNDGSIKRLIITSEYTVITDANQIPSLKIENYLFK